MNTNPWTEDRVEAMKKLWEAGLSATQISNELGAAPFQDLPSVSRNAVIGKIHRMGLSGRVKGQHRSEPKMPRSSGGFARPRQHKAFNIQPPTRVAAALAMVEEPEGQDGIEAHADGISDHDNVIPLRQRISLLDLNDATCHWPIGDPQSPEFFFCGGKALTGLPYCAHHTRVSTQPAAEYRRQRSKV